MAKPNQQIAVIPSRNVLVFPGNSVPLRIGRPKSKAAIEYSQEQGNEILLIAQKDPELDQDPTPSDLYRIGTLCRIERVVGSKEQGFQLLVQGLERVRVEKFVQSSDCLLAEVSSAPENTNLDEQTSAALLATTKELSLEILRLIPGDTRQISSLVEAIGELPLLANICSENLQVSLAKKQALLEKDSLKDRVLELLQLMQLQKETLSLQHEIRDKLSSKLGKQQRESLLREQMRAIQDELGEGQENREEDYFSKIEKAEMPEKIRSLALSEARKLASTPTSSPESSVLRNYLDLLCAMPWNKSSTDRLEIDKAREILNTDHHGLEKIKKRITEHLSVMKLRKDGKGSILLLVGPPGVGKTSLGHSIAKATDREFVRVSLGGVRDDSEIRGHRRTYVGALPGRIVQGIKRAGVNNPVLMLDEIDKLGRGFAGDPASALLEVLDPEQNTNFTDHYLDVPFDLSKVLFIATANSLETIPAPLLDRMEVIELSGYTTAEKLHIARNHLLPKQLLEHGMTAEHMTLSDDLILRVINHYTREAGVRNLQRNISAICRATTERVVTDKEALPIRIDRSALEDILGPDRYQHEVAERVVPPGVVTGLAWTPRGGEILFVESSLMPGKGQLLLTGQLGEIMKESAQIALSLIRSTLPELVPASCSDKKDIHIHVPAGAIPKDGPSAGITMLTALASLFSGVMVSPKTAMTGEITLRGAVTPVGGIKEKVLGAHRAGIERIILSKRNERDLTEVPEEIRSQIRFDFVENAAELLEKVLGLKPSNPHWDERDPSRVGSTEKSVPA